jgi:PRTRC genetic system protein A
MLNPIDVALQSVTPAVMVPRRTAFEELDTPGHRILMAGNGIWLEVLRAWLYVRVLISPQLPLAVPYGNVSSELRLKFGKLPLSMVHQFTDEARTKLPNECAGWVIWNESTGAWRLHMLQELSVDRNHVNMILPILGESEHLVIDVHSHGSSHAFFSPTDDNDDLGEAKITGVIGSLDQANVTAKFRLCVDGVFVPLSF